MKNPNDLQPPHIFGYDSPKSGLFTVRRIISTVDELLDQWTLRINDEYDVVLGTMIPLHWPSANEAIAAISSANTGSVQFDEIAREAGPSS